jgi:hypothetical protein
MYLKRSERDEPAENTSYHEPKRRAPLAAYGVSTARSIECFARRLDTPV